MKEKQITNNELLALKAYNVAKLDEILANPNHVEELGRKYYGDNWQIVFAGERHPLNKIKEPKKVGRPKQIQNQLIED
jgi:hypothetical protein